MRVQTDFLYLKSKASDKQTIQNLKVIESDWNKVRKEGRLIKDKKTTQISFWQENFLCPQR